VEPELKEETIKILNENVVIQKETDA